MTVLIIITIIAALLFAIINGLHDGGNVMATIVASRSISVKSAMGIAFIAEFLGAMLLGSAVAVTIGTGVISKDDIFTSSIDISILFLLSALIGAILWNLITWKLKMPSSSSHALIGGLIGGGIAAFGIHSVLWTTVFFKIILFMFLAPIIGMVIGFFVFVTLKRLFMNSTRPTEQKIKQIQIFSMATLSFFYGSNDAQKSMGVIALLLAILAGSSEFIVLPQIRISCALALSIGMLIGGVRMIKTIGTKIYRLEPIHSFSSQLATAAVLLTANTLGAPISTTQLITSSVMGVGSGDNIKYVKWEIVGKIAASWLTTIPCAAAVSFLIFMAVNAVM